MLDVKLTDYTATCVNVQLRKTVHVEGKEGEIIHETKWIRK